MPLPKRASGANVRIYGSWETTYGAVSGDDGFNLPMFSLDLNAAQSYGDDILLGAGADPLPTEKGAVTVQGTAEIPLDRRAVGYHLAALFGAETAAPQQGAWGFIDFGPAADDLPAADSTIALNGTTWTFKASGATGAQTNIGATVEATVTQLASDLNASADTEVAKCTYTAYGRRLEIQHDTVGTSGNSYTLAAAAASGGRRSGATLAGGGLYKHTWHSGDVDLPSLSIEVQHPDLDVAAERYNQKLGVKANTLTVTRAREGAVRAQLALIARDEDYASSSQMGTPTELTVDMFGSFEGSVRSSGRKVANITGGNFSISRSLDVVDGLDDDGLIAGADTGVTRGRFSITVRYGIDELLGAARAGSSFELQWGFRHAATGARLTVILHDCRLGLPTRPISEGAIEATYGNGVCFKSQALGYAATVELVNDVSALYYS